MLIPDKQHRTPVYIDETDCEPSVVSERVNHEGQLSVKDVRPGVRVILHSSDPRDRGQLFVFTSLPESRVSGSHPSLWVTARDEVGNTRSLSLADMGITAYENGQWNRCNYTVPAPDPT